MLFQPKFLNEPFISYVRETLYHKKHTFGHFTTCLKTPLGTV